MSKQILPSQARDPLRPPRFGRCESLRDSVSIYPIPPQLIKRRIPIARPLALCSEITTSHRVRRVRHWGFDSDAETIGVRLWLVPQTPGPGSVAHCCWTWKNCCYCYSSEHESLRVNAIIVFSVAWICRGFNYYSVFRKHKTVILPFQISLQALIEKERIRTVAKTYFDLHLFL